MSREQPDGYWLKMGGEMVIALSDVLLPDLTEHRKEIVGEYFGELLDNAYKMGIRLGAAQERYKAIERRQLTPTP